MKDSDEAKLKADVDEIMERVKHIMDKVAALDPANSQEDKGEPSP